ncbi:hypothetical protein TNCV_2941231, partial [Trichonephila clavipes]
AGQCAVLLDRWIVRSVPLEIAGSSGHEGTHVWKTRSGFNSGRPRGVRDGRIMRQALVDPTVTRSTIRADVGVAIVPQTISRHLAEANLNPTFSCTPFNTRTSTTAFTVVPSQINVECHKIGKKVVFSDESRFVLGDR